MELEQIYLEENPYTRPGLNLINPEWLVAHWTAWPGADAGKILELFQGRAKKKEFGSTQYIVDHHRIIETMPPRELAPQVSTTNGITPWGEDRIGAGMYNGYSNANWYCVGAEMCIVNSEGEYDNRTWENATRLFSQLCHRFNRNPWRDIITHYQVVGYKDCPRWMVRDPSELERFRWDVANRMGIAD